jgi:hypothetical protein
MCQEWVAWLYNHPVLTVRVWIETGTSWMLKPLAEAISFTCNVPQTMGTVHHNYGVHTADISVRYEQVYKKTNLQWDAAFHFKLLIVFFCEHYIIMYLQVQFTCLDNRMLSCVCKSISFPTVLSRVQWEVGRREEDQSTKVIFYDVCSLRELRMAPLKAKEIHADIWWETSWKTGQ